MSPNSTKPMLLDILRPHRKLHHSHTVHRNLSSLFKLLQRSWLNLCNDVPTPIQTLCQILILFASISALNYFVTTVFMKLLVQCTVGYGGNIMYWHHPFIEPTESTESTNSIDSQSINHSVSKMSKIPFIIHQTFKSKESIPSKWSESGNLWPKHHPKWKYIFWTDDDIDNFMSTHYPWFVPLFESYEYPIQKVDVARYFIIYHFGGIYCDLDIAPKMNIEPLLTNDIEVFLVETPNLGLTNSLFGSAPRSEVEPCFGC